MLGALISVPAMTSQNIVSDGDTREASLVSVEVIPNDELESTLPADVQRMLENSESEIITRGGDAPSGAIRPNYAV